MSTYIWPELREKLENPIVFQTVIAGQSPGSGPKALFSTVAAKLASP